MSDPVMIALITSISQLGLAAAAFRLGSKVDKRQADHEEVDKQFHSEVRAKLGIVKAA